MSRHRGDPRTAERAAKGEKKRLTALAHLPLVLPGEPLTPEDRGLQVCPCPTDCTLYADCLLCVAYHAHRGVLSRCRR